MQDDSTIFIGLDVHKDSITVACIGSSASDPVIDVGTIGTQQYAIDRLIAKLSGRGALQFVYEAGPCGFWLQRYLQAKRQACTVVAPSLIPKRPGDRIKTDRRDARNLALKSARRDAECGACSDAGARSISRRCPSLAAVQARHHGGATALEVLSAAQRYPL